MNTDKNTALYEKMAAEQDKFRDWLKSQPPEEIVPPAPIALKLPFRAPAASLFQRAAPMPCSARKPCLAFSPIWLPHPL